MNKVLVVLVVFFITSCSNEVNEDQLVERNGIFYEVNSQEPFTGTALSYDENGQLRAKGNFKNGEWVRN